MLDTQNDASASQLETPCEPANAIDMSLGWSGNRSEDARRRGRAETIAAIEREMVPQHAGLN
jgi:hypothetical protein